MKSVTIQCPAKINTFLAVGPPDASGYHPIRSVMRTISMFDTLHCAVGGDEDVIECDSFELPERNTLSKALRLVRELADIPPVHIVLEKRIPVQSGLGGGSSDAAGLLRWVQKTFGSVWSGSLMEIAAAVGADVPFFLVGGSAIAEGYGEDLTPLADEEPKWMVIAQPEDRVSTLHAYQRMDEHTREWRALPTDLWELHNDFECIAPCGSLELIDRMLIAGACGAQMSGSGSAVFGIFEDRVSAETAEERLRSEGWATVQTARTMKRAESLWIS